MKMISEKRAIDKIFRRRNRYEIPDWQRGKVWGPQKQRRLIDSILRGWKLPKFSFIKTSGEDYLVEDGQQRLTAIWEFFSNRLTLAPETAREFGGRKYRDLPRNVADLFDDFEIEFDVIEEAKDEELKEYFQRLQEGMPLTSSEKLNSFHSKLRDFCSAMSKHPFFRATVATPDTRYAHFDIMAKVATIEIEGLDAGLRYNDIAGVFSSQTSFANNSAIAKRIKAALDLLQRAFKDKGSSLRTRTIVQSLITLTCKIVTTNHAEGHEAQLRKFFETFMSELADQVEKGQTADDSDYVSFQLSVNANVKSGAKTRQQILLRKLFRISPDLAGIFDAAIISESGVSGRIATQGDAVADLISHINSKYSSVKGEDLFKATNKTAQSLVRIRKPIQDRDGYGNFVDDLYFLFRESVGQRLDVLPPSFVQVNDLRTELRHDVDHGDSAKVRSKKRRAGSTFRLFAGHGTPDTIEPTLLPLVQSNILGAIEGDLKILLLRNFQEALSSAVAPMQPRKE